MKLKELLDNEPLIVGLVRSLAALAIGFGAPVDNAAVESALQALSGILATVSIIAVRQKVSPTKKRRGA